MIVRVGTAVGARIGRGLGVSLLVGASVVGANWGCAATSKEPAPPESDEESDGASYDSLDKGFRVAGPLLYVRNCTRFDDVTLVAGGAVEGAAVAYRDRALEKSHWFFLSGSSLYVASEVDGPSYASTSSPGRFLTTTRPYEWAPEREADRRALSWLVVDLYARSQQPPIDPDDVDQLIKIRHAPFFVGKGWTGGRGATWSEVQDLCDSLGLVPRVRSATTHGFVRQQRPSGGRPMPIDGGDTIDVWFDGASTPAPAPPAGDHWTSPVLVSDPDGDDLAIVPIEVTSDHRDDAKSPVPDADRIPKPRDRKDLFVALPPESLGREVSIRPADARDEVIFTAWKVVGGALVNIPSSGLPYTAQLGIRPKLEVLHDSGPIVIMVEFDKRNPGRTALRIEW